MAKNTGGADRLQRLFHHRWATPVLAALRSLGGGAKFVTLEHRLAIGRDSLKRTLAALSESGWVNRNPGYGHPMRPEYLLTPAGARLAPHCSQLQERVEALKVASIAYNKWSLPVVFAMGTGDERFNAIKDRLPGITPRALTQALRDLQDAGLIRRYVVDGDPPHTEYTLSRGASSLTTILEALADARP